MRELVRKYLTYFRLNDMPINVKFGKKTMISKKRRTLYFDEEELSKMKPELRERAIVHNILHYLGYEHDSEGRRFGFRKELRADGLSFEIVKDAKKNKYFDLKRLGFMVYRGM